MRRFVSTLVIGGGPAAVFATAAQSDDGVLVTRNPLGMLAPVSQVFPGVSGCETLVPVLAPATQTTLSSMLAAMGVWPERVGELPRIRFVYPFSSPSTPHPSPNGHWGDGSYAQFASKLGSRTASLSWKQYGAQSVAEPLLLVREKVLRNYYSATSKPGTLGYVDGCSPYFWALQALLPRIRVVPASLTGVDSSRRVATLSDGKRCAYQRLVYCGPLPQLSKVLGLEPPVLRAAPAHFVVGTFTGGIGGGHVVYDERPDSPLFRVVTPTDNTCVVQVARDIGDTNQLDWHIARAEVARLLEAESVSLHPYVRTFSHAYPVEPVSAKASMQLDEAASQAGIVRFGRFAQWDYLDLYELPWHVIIS